MSSTWTRESVLRLAPDAGSAKAGQDLGTPRKWVSFNSGEASIWGLCQGSGKQPYQTIVDLTEPAFKCSCPSRKFPCKHGLGLLLLYAGDTAAFARADRPAWVQEWLDSRQERARKKAEAAEKPAAPIDLEAQAERREKRIERIVTGLASLRTWLDDLVRQGIATVPTRGYTFFDEPARRMIDAQAPGVARMIQTLGATAHSGAGWHRSFLQQLGSLHALLRAVERLDQLPEGLRDDVMSTIGLPMTQEEVLARPPITDTWQVIAQEVVFEEKLRSQLTWLFASVLRRPALVLHFAHGTGPLDASFVVGTAFSAELCLFPGNGVRAVVKSRQPVQVIQTIGGYDSLDELCVAYSEQLAKQPWLGGVVYPMRNLKPVHEDKQWNLTDAGGNRLPARMSPATAWRVTAASGGHPIDLAVRFDGETLEPLTMSSEGQSISLGTNLTEGAGLAG